MHCGCVKVQQNWRAGKGHSPDPVVPLTVCGIYSRVRCPSHPSSQVSPIDSALPHVSSEARVVRAGTGVRAGTSHCLPFSHT